MTLSILFPPGTAEFRATAQKMAEPPAICVVVLGLWRKARKSPVHRWKRSPSKLREILPRAWQEYEAHGGIPHEQFCDELAEEVK